VLTGVQGAGSHRVAKTALREAERLSALQYAIPRRIVAHRAWRLRRHIACARKSRKRVTQGPLGPAVLPPTVCACICCSHPYSVLTAVLIYVPILSLASDVDGYKSSRVRTGACGLWTWNLPEHGRA